MPGYALIFVCINVSGITTIRAVVHDFPPNLLYDKKHLVVSILVTYYIIIFFVCQPVL